MVAFVANESVRAATAQTAERRFGRMTDGGGAIVGTAPELVDHFGAWGERGVERIYTWFSDFAEVETLSAFGDDVIRRMR
jgi:hypothetical protein